MPVTDLTKIAKVYLIYGVPNRNTVFASSDLVSVAGPKGEIYTFDGVKLQIDTALAAVITEEEALLDIILAKFDKDFLAHELITKDGDTEGILFDAGPALEMIRRRTSDLLGVYLPEGGYMASFRRQVDEGGVVTR